MLKAKYALIALSVLLSGTLTSCLEDEKNPFAQEDGFYAQLPGDGEIYPGSEVELRGEGFTSSDKIYIYSDGMDSPTEARITSVTSDRLFFIMPGAFQDVEVYVVIQRDGENTLLGSLWVRSYIIDFNFYGYGSCYWTYIYGSEFDDCKMYLQELDYDHNPIGESIEIEMLERTENYCLAQVYPTTVFCTITLERNGEVVSTETFDVETGYASYEWYECSLGETVSLLWEGFIDTDEIILLDDFNNEVQVDYTIDDGNASFVVPETLVSGTIYYIKLKRYENYDYFGLGYFIY